MNEQAKTNGTPAQPDLLGGASTPRPLPKNVYADKPPLGEQKRDGIFTEAQNSQGYVKIGIYGDQGSGKSTTSALIAIGLSKTYHNSAPVFMHDTENGSDFLAPLFEIEKVPFITRKTRSFKEMCIGLHEAQRRGACCYLEDSLTSDWAELLESFKKARNITQIEVYHWGIIKPQWSNEWVVPMLNAQLHIIVAGRAGAVFEQVANEEGKLKMERTGTKMKAEGDFGYEPNLLIEMEATRKLSPGRRRGGNFDHKAYVLKDRTRTIQGKEFSWPDINNYKPGDWKKVFGQIEPHIRFFHVGQAHQGIHSDPGSSSAELFDAQGNADYYRRKQDRQILVEEIEGMLVAIWPGQDVKSKKFKADTLEALFQTRSWTQIMERVSLGDLEIGLVRLRTFRSRTEGIAIETEETFRAHLQEAMDYRTEDQIHEAAMAKLEAIHGQLSESGLAVYSALDFGEDKVLGLDAVIEKADVGPSETMRVLSEMELRGFVGQLPGKRFCRVPLNRVTLTPQSQPVSA